MTIATTLTPIPTPCPDPDAHALVLIEIKGGDFVAAWTLALENAYCTRRDAAEVRYWLGVAERITLYRQKHEYLRGSQFSSKEKHEETQETKEVARQVVG